MTLSIGSVGQNPFQFLQQTTGQQPPTGTASTDGTLTNQAQGAHHHRHGGGAGGAVSDLLSTIASALQSADSSSDPNKVIENTVAKLLAGNGTTGGTNGTDADGDSDGSAQASGQSSSQSSNAQSFAQLLQAHGVDFQQFRSDLLAAVKDAQNGQVNPGTALKSFAPGSSLNLTA
jgi:hypothetical protein